MDLKKLMQPFGLEIDLDTGVMREPERRIVRKASDMRGYYKDEAALENLVAEHDDPLHYEVFEKPVPKEYGQLMFCISKLQPGLVGEECFMTKGHYHTVAETAEIYLCIRGKGYMFMKAPDGRCVAERLTRHRFVYVPPYWGHRSINTGKEPLISFCIYPGDAGHNYGDIEAEGFPKRVFVRDGEEVIE